MPGTLPAVSFVDPNGGFFDPAAENDEHPGPGPGIRAGQSFVAGDASLILAYQLIAAKLNIDNGSNPAPISSTITDADGDLDGGTIPQGVAASSTLGQDMTADASKLDNYNSSRLTPMCTGPR